ncbi:hypothetical protein DPMN_162693 [Dreissena polymorpha]|uniref:Uncharacterized protein n=1 Tax=Dreissena polymorpha TaxID=45954 RepID=A0A9D4ESK0_DREPO|nr:hypothetical protein DPMN_162594 [Dreissena polymorpha]KAH3784728.1 hypothetical protein DPMN_162693 [Dreissena polymorpha]
MSPLQRLHYVWTRSVFQHRGYIMCGLGVCPSTEATLCVDPECVPAQRLHYVWTRSVSQHRGYIMCGPGVCPSTEATLCVDPECAHALLHV